VLIWGRNPAVTNIHLLPLIKDKEVLVIDAIKSKTAKMYDFIQVKPSSDYFLAILLAKEVIERGVTKREDGNNFNEYKNILKSYDKEDLMKKCGVANEKLNFLFDFIKDGAVVLTGLGVAKCKECYKTTWVIDSLFFILDFFGKRDRGVAFLGSSSYGLNNPFAINHKNKIALFDVNLDDYDVVFIQGANPLVSFVNRNEWKKLKEKTTIVFGKYYDETAKLATLFLPSKDFYEKKDVRGSYFHEYVLTNENPIENNKFISEYELTKFLFEAFGFEGLEAEDKYIAEILNTNLEKIDDGLYKKRVFDLPPYSDGFFTSDKKFNFLTEKFEYIQKPFEIITAKETNALNSQFQRDSSIYINTKSKNIMLRYKNNEIDYSKLPDILKWLIDNNLLNKIKYSNDIPENIVFAKGGEVINEFLKAEGENAWYENI
jgi:anaerobic selenocysteine-containing dehydrogenase